MQNVDVTNGIWVWIDHSFGRGVVGVVAVVTRRPSIRSFAPTDSYLATKQWWLPCVYPQPWVLSTWSHVHKALDKFMHSRTQVTVNHSPSLIAVPNYGKLGYSVPEIQRTHPPTFFNIVALNPQFSGRLGTRHEVVINSATKNAADPSTLQWRILTTADDASQLVAKVKERCTRRRRRLALVFLVQLKAVFFPTKHWHAITISNLFYMKKVSTLEVWSEIGVWPFHGFSCLDQALTECLIAKQRKHSE